MRSPGDPRFGEVSGAMLDRAQRNTTSAITTVRTRAETTPLDTICAWREERNVDATPQDLVDLAERLRATDPFAEDGKLLGAKMVSALRKQAERLRAENWPAGNRLRLSAEYPWETLSILGLL